MRDSNYHSAAPRWVTHPSLHLRDAHDAHIVLEAVRLNVLPLIKRRLVMGEREQLQAGNVFVWEEAEDSDEGGLLRWTDGRRWSQSRMRGDYLFYEEKVETTQEEKDAKAARRARRASDPTAAIPPPTRRKDRPAKPNGLTKQTYSAVMQLPGETKPKKWHVVAYFSGTDYTRLPTVESYDYLRRIRVPEGLYFSSKGTLTPNPPNSRMYYASHEDAFEPLGRTSPSPSSPISSSSTASSSTSPLVLSRPLPGSQQQPAPHLILPPLSSISDSLPSRPVYSRSYTAAYPQKSYTPLTSEDRRVLERFRVCL